MFARRWWCAIRIGWSVSVSSRRLSPGRTANPRAGRRLITIPLLRWNCHYLRTQPLLPPATPTSSLPPTQPPSSSSSLSPPPILQPPSPTDNEKVARGSHEGERAGSCGALPTTRQKRTDLDWGTPREIVGDSYRSIQGANNVYYKHNMYAPQPPQPLKNRERIKLRRRSILSGVNEQRPPDHETASHPRYISDWRDLTRRPAQFG